MKVKSKKGVCIHASPSVATVDDAIDRLFNEISPLITAARERVAVGVNTELTKLNWNVGNCINREILGRGRAEYGKQIVKGLASRLMLFHGSGWDEKTLRHCLRAAETFDDKELYLIGASLKDLGHKCFGFTKMDAGAIRGIKKSAFGSGAGSRGLI